MNEIIVIYGDAPNPHLHQSGWETEEMKDRGDKLAEICGIHAGDGYLRDDGKRVELSISGNIEEKDFYENHVIPLFSTYFDIDLEGKYFPSNNTYGFVIRERKVVSFLHKLGFPYGKKTLIVRVPEFVFKSKGYTTKFLRGFFDTDGCVTLDKKNKVLHYYPRIMLTTCSKNLSDGLLKSLNKLEITHWLQVREPKNPKWNTAYIIWIRGEIEVEKWFEIIGSKNNSKLSHYLIWKKHGFCPPHLTYEQRKQILIESKNPLIFYKKASVAQFGRATGL